MINPPTKLAQPIRMVIRYFWLTGISRDHAVKHTYQPLVVASIALLRFNKMASISVVFLIIATPFSQFLVRAILTREKQNYVNIFIEIRSYEHL